MKPHFIETHCLENMVAGSKMVRRESPPWRNRTPLYHLYTQCYHRVPLSNVGLVRVLIHELEARIGDPDLQEWVTEHFNPKQYLHTYYVCRNESRIDAKTAFIYAETIRRVKCLLVVLKKIDKFSRELGVSETIEAIMRRFRTHIDNCSYEDTYEYDILRAVCKLHDVLYKTIETLIESN